MLSFVVLFSNVSIITVCLIYIYHYDDDYNTNIAFLGGAYVQHYDVFIVRILLTRMSIGSSCTHSFISTRMILCNYCLIQEYFYNSDAFYFILYFNHCGVMPSKL